MRPIIRGFAASLVLGGLAACGGGGAGVQPVLPSSGIPQSASAGLAAPSSAAQSAAVLRAPADLAGVAAADTYAAPFGNFVSATQIVLEPQGKCGHISATLAAGAGWPAFLKTLPAGKTIALSGTASYPDDWSRSNGCPTGGFSTLTVTLGGPSASPTPNPLPTDDGASLNFGHLAPNYDPPASWHPYKANSPWNQRLSASPRLDPNDGSKIHAMFNSAFGPNQYQGRIGTPLASVLSSGSTATFPYYFAKTSDPSVIVNCTAGYGTCQMQGKHYNVPAQAMAATDIDHHIIIIQPDGSELDVWEWGYGNVGYGGCCGQAPPWRSNETVNVSWGGVANVATSTGWDLNTNGITAAGNDGLGGLIREPEIASGTIGHALSAVIYCSPTSTPVYPALHSSDQRNCNGFSMSPSQIVATGNRLWLDLTDTQINALGSVNATQKTVLHALHDYGAFVIDYNGYDPVSFGGLESQLPGYIYGNDIVSNFVAGHLPLWFNKDGVNWHDVLSDGDMNSIVQPHLHVLAPCVNNGFPGGQC